MKMIELEPAVEDTGRYICNDGYVRLRFWAPGDCAHISAIDS